MPVRRPGGKYRGLIARNKSDADLAKEARERLRRATEAAIRRGKARSRRQEEGQRSQSKSLKRAQDEMESEKQQRILNMLMGGKRGNLKKFFMAWITGMELLKKEDLIHEREVAWQSTCLKDSTGRCSAAARLRPTLFELPFDALSAALKTGTLTGGLESPSLPRRLLNSVGSLRPQSVGSLQDMFRRQEVTVKEEASPLAEPKAAWILGGEAVMHYKSGRKYKLDPLSMRIAPISDPSKIEKHAEKPNLVSALATSEGRALRSNQGGLGFRALRKLPS
eukprot:s681_g2.t1